MITITNRPEPKTQDPLVLDYRRARTALVLHLAATAGISCCQRSYPCDLWPGTSGFLKIEFEPDPHTHRDFVKLRDFLSALQDHSLIPWLSLTDPASLTVRERDWPAEYGLVVSAMDHRGGEDSPRRP